MGTLASGSDSQDLGTADTTAPGWVPYAALELRVHGVHGTSPASMLGVRTPRQVAGDGITGVFRAEGGPERHQSTSASTADAGPSK